MNTPDLYNSFIEYINTTYLLNNDENSNPLPNAPYLIATFICTNIIVCRIKKLCISECEKMRMISQILSLEGIMKLISEQVSPNGKKFIFISFLSSTKSIFDIHYEKNHKCIKKESQKCLKNCTNDDDIIEFLKDKIFGNILKNYDKLVDYLVYQYSLNILSLDQVNMIFGFNIMCPNTYNCEIIQRWIDNIL